MEEDEHAAMQAMMGFSSFGDNKRHKSNSGAVTSRPKNHATSSNSTPLGTRPVQPVLEQAGPAAEQATNEFTQASSETTPLQHEQHEQHDQHQSTQYSKNDIPLDPAYWSQQPQHHRVRDNRQAQGYTQRGYDTRPDDDEVGFTSPWTGETMTNRELREYGRGKLEDGPDGRVTVFFKKSFLEDPWARSRINGQIVQSRGPVEGEDASIEHGVEVADYQSQPIV